MIRRENLLGGKGADDWLTSLRGRLGEIDSQIQAIIGQSLSFPQASGGQGPLVGELIERLVFDQNQRELRDKLWQLVKDRVNFISQVGIVKANFGLEVYQLEVEMRNEDFIRQKATQEGWDLTRLDFTLTFQRCLTGLAKNVQRKIIASWSLERDGFPRSLPPANR